MHSASKYQPTNLYPVLTKPFLVKALAELYADVKKYKLASSEGINKIANRVIRYETMYKICVESGTEILERLSVLENDFENKLKERKKDELEKDDLVDIED